MKQDTFSSYHPVLNLVYFCFVLAVTMFMTHPVFLMISLAGGTIYSARLKGLRGELKYFVFFSLPVMVIITFMNSLFNHYGVTVLGYMKDGNPITLESLVYGLVMALMLCGVMAIFRCLNEVMTSDKFIYLFGRILPALSLVISMVMRFVPVFKKRADVISNGQKGLGRDLQTGTPLQKIEHGIKILSILISWSLENAIVTADSMKSRGYGLPGRSAFSIYRFEKRDRYLLLLFAGLAAAFLAGCSQGVVYAAYNPRIVISGWPVKLSEAGMYLVYAVFCFLPVILDCLEEAGWRRLQAGITEQKVLNWRVFDME